MHFDCYCNVLLFEEHDRMCFVVTIHIQSVFGAFTYTNRKRNVTESYHLLLNAVIEAEEPAEMGELLGQGPIATNPFCLQG